MANGFQHRITIRKEALKFSAAHFTVFADGTKEALHGHNYRTRLDAVVSEPSLNKMVPFSLLKAALKEICSGWDEKVLLPLKCPHLSQSEGSPKQAEFTVCGKFYSLPQDEVEWLAVDNITTENLAMEVLTRLLASLKPLPAFAPVLELSVRIEEITGQGAACSWKR